MSKSIRTIGVAAALTLAAVGGKELSSTHSTQPKETSAPAGELVLRVKDDVTNTLETPPTDATSPSVAKTPNEAPKFVERLGVSGTLTDAEARKTGAPLVPTLDLPRGEPYTTQTFNDKPLAVWLDPANAEDAPQNGIEPRYENYTGPLTNSVEYFTAYQGNMSPAVRATAADLLVREAENYLSLDPTDVKYGRGMELAAQIYATVGKKQEAKDTLLDAMRVGPFAGCEGYLDDNGCGFQEGVFNGDKFTYLTFVARGLDEAARTDEANKDRAKKVAESIRSLEGSHLGE